MTKEKHITKCSFEYTGGPSRRRTWGRKEEEYSADFLLVTKRTLDEADYRIFRYHYLLGADWKLCCRKLKMDRGNFFHAIYRIEQTLGKTFRELKPYALFPLDEYFSGVACVDQDESRMNKVVQMERKGPPLSALVPLRKAA